MSLFYRSLATMFQSGVPLDRALDMLARQQPNPMLRSACQGLAQRVQSGSYLSTAMARWPGVFDPHHSRLVGVGEKSGRLGAVLTQLAEMVERRASLHMKVQSALVVPLMASALCVLMVALAPPLLFRGLLEMLQSQGGSLPWPTRLLIAFSQAIRSPWLWLLALFLGGLGLAALRRLARGPGLRLALRRQLLRLPALGPCLRVAAICQFARTLAILLRSGVPLLSALQSAGEASGDACLELDLVLIRQRVSEGALLSEALREGDYFPASFYGALGAGEESGSLEEMCRKMADLYEVELNHALELATRSLEPLLLAAIGTVVGFTVVAVLLPMVRVLETL